MTAKPQPMAGQFDPADDLIAELAKLMAQDAKSDSPAKVAAPTFAVRIPGEAAAAASPVPRFDFGHAAAPAALSNTAAPTAGAVPAAAPKAAPEPFDFDFGLGPAKPAPTAPTAPQTTPPAASAAEPTAPAMAAVSTVEHDSIADLIAAELSGGPAVAEPAIEPAPTPVPPVVSRAAAQPGTGWAPTAVAANLGGQDKPERAPLRPLNLQPAPKPEQDRFKVPPVFGLGSRPAAEPVVGPVVEDSVPAVPVAAPLAPLPANPVVAVAPPVQGDDSERDPIDEIEHLIGRAMRVEFDKPATPAAPERPAPSPALRSLATPTVPVAAPAAESRPAGQRVVSGADEAILAAAEATGAQIGWVEAPEIDELQAAAPPASRQRPRRSLGMTRAVAGPLVAVTLLLAAGFGLYWVLGLGSDTGPAPLLTADGSPTKETPAVQPDAAATQQSVVFNEIEGVVPGAEEQLVSRDQTDVNEVTQVPTAADLSEEGLANRKVRTVTVRPDGTIVSGEDSVAGSAILPVARPNVPAVPGVEAASTDLLASVEPTAPASDATAVATSAPETATAAITPVTPGSIVPAVDITGAPLAGKTAPVPMLRPAGLAQSTAPTSPVNAVVDAATASGNILPPPPSASALGLQPATPAAQPAAAAVSIPGAVEVEALPNSAPAYAQLASLRSEAEARQAAQNLVTRFGPLFGGANMEVQRVDLGARGIYYRVRVPATSTQAANNICINVKAAGGDCVLM